MAKKEKKTLKNIWSIFGYIIALYLFRWTMYWEAYGFINPFNPSVILSMDIFTKLVAVAVILSFVYAVMGTIKHGKENK